MFIGPNNRFLIPAAAVFGASLLITADLVGRTVFAPVVLQVGVVMAFLGGFVFLWLLLRKDSKIWS
jgi:iron complex transport system permease protein